MKPRPLHSATTLSIVMLPIMLLSFSHPVPLAQPKSLSLALWNPSLPCREEVLFLIRGNHINNRTAKDTPRIRIFARIQGTKVAFRGSTLVDAGNPRPLFYDFRRFAPGCQPHHSDLQKYHTKEISLCQAKHAKIPCIRYNSMLYCSY